MEYHLLFRSISNGALALVLAGSAATALAQPLERVQPGDATLDCAGIARESKALEGVIAAGETSAAGKAAVGAAANVGGQVAGAAAAQQARGLFGSLGAVVSKAAGAVAQQTAEEKMQPDADARAAADAATARRDFLDRLGRAKDCRADEPGRKGKTLSSAEFQQLAEAAPGGGLAKVTALSPASVQSALKEPVSTYAANGLVEGNLNLKGKRFYIAEFRVLFEVGGSVSANTRAGYIPGRDYGATNVKVNYSVPNVDVAAFQAITDRVYEDFKTRLAAAGVKPEDWQAFVRENGAVYESTEEASKPGAPVFYDKGRKYLVMSPTGMKLHPRGLAGIGAGNIGKRMEWSKGNLEGVSISMAVNIAALESSGNHSSILRHSSSANASESMIVGAAPDAAIIQTHANTTGGRMTKGLAVEGNFAAFREVGGYDSDKDAVAKTMGMLSNMAGLGANKSKRVDMEVDLDGPATARMALKGLATINQALVDQIKAAR